VSKLSEARHRIAAMGMAEAQQELKANRRKLFELRLQLSRGEVKDNRQFPRIKADIARLMFRLGELNRMEPEDDLELEAATEESPAAATVPASATSTTSTTSTSDDTLATDEESPA
jgi:ribosomal protein L29